MKKTFVIENLECAHCAAKMEKAIRKHDGVISVSVNFFKSDITIEAEDDVFYDVIKYAKKECKKIEPDAEIII